MQDVRTSHQNDLAHHAQQAKAWLTCSANGEHTAAISYAALELRFAVERLAVHYWATLLDRPPEEKDLRGIESFKRVENRIYELGGHQREINAHFEFMRVIFTAMKIDTPLTTPNIGELSRIWHDCSELCHVAWPLSCAVPEARVRAFKMLSEWVAVLLAQAASLGWPGLKEAGFVELRDHFVASKATAEDILAYVSKTGIWARAEFPDGRQPVFVGEAIAPSAEAPSA